MTKDDIIRMAREAGAKTPRSIWPPTLAMSIDFAPEQLERFAALVADTEAKRIHDEGMVTVGHMREKIAAAVAAEREACASLAGDLYAKASADEIEMAIRARTTQ